MRKPQIQPALASLTLGEREQLADWLRHGDYDDVLVRVNQPRPEGFGLNISKSPLQTFYAKVALFDVINAQLSADKKMSLATFESLGQRHIHLFLSASGDEEKLAAAHQAILNTTVELAGTATSATQLLALQRLADFPERAALRAAKEERAQEMHEHKIALDLRKQDRADRAEQRATDRLDLAKKIVEQKLRTAASNSKLETSNSKLNAEDRPGDHLGPFARNWDEISERARIHFGVSKEEWARRTGANEEQSQIEDAQLESTEDLCAYDDPSQAASDDSPCNADFQSAVSPICNRQPSSNSNPIDTTTRADAPDDIAPSNLDPSLSVSLFATHHQNQNENP